MDARSLLRAKKAEARVDHPYAAYSAAGVLRCSICAVPVKQWDAHLLTKQHRTSVSREKALQAKQQQKRSAAEALDSAEGSTSKRAKTQESAAEGKNGQETKDDDDEDEGVPALPAGFFSSGNKPSIGETAAASEEDAQKKTVEPTGDPELDDFLASLETDDALALPTTAETAAVPTAASQKKRYQSSSSAAVPGVASYEAAPVRLAPSGEEVQAEEQEEEPTETEEERRARIAREEREEIMGRLEEEERAQEDADSRVTALKARMEALKKKREARIKKPAKQTGEGVNGA
ncbi:hypothetical protein DB88DRAFT_300217 [Papiliotrema laurentii]|uniref:Zinc finger protein 830 n=1 Tax=Papiliotrema laurentii TaxID=5418 RepID=A0AAD9FLB1_PAPLA|nr:hypothetical protein DB88DRAFT_300217 [Papiliotrema laurentii]